MSSKRILLVDADVLTYESAFAAQKNIYHLVGTTEDKGWWSEEHKKVMHFEPQTFSSHDKLKEFCNLQMLDLKALQAAGFVMKETQVLPVETALLIARNKLAEVRAACGGAAAVLYLSCPSAENYRTQLAYTKPYKGNREQEKPVHFLAVREYYEHCGAKESKGEEADDEISYTAYDLAKRGFEPVVCSIDKDLIQIEGLHYDWGKDTKYRVDAESAHLYFMMQCLSGDSTDNIPGLPGIGPVKAKKALLEATQPYPACDTLRKQRWHVVKEMYNRWAHDENGNRVRSWREYLQEQASLVWIRKEPGEIWNIESYQEKYFDKSN
jgi:hypothetical protein